MLNIVPGWVYAPVSIGLLIYLTLIVIVLRAPISPLAEIKSDSDSETDEKVVSSIFALYL